MDPNRGTLYPSVEAARAAGVWNPVGIDGRREDVEHVAAAVHTEWTREQKAARNAANRTARQSRRTNRKRGAR